MNRRLVVWGTILLLSTLILVFVVLTPSDSDPLGKVQAKAYHELIGNSSWLGGFWDAINLPASAAPEEVLRKYFSSNQTYTIIEVRKIDIPVTTLYAALVEAGGRRQIILLRHESDGWAAREDRE